MNRRDFLKGSVASSLLLTGCASPGGNGRVAKVQVPPPVKRLPGCGDPRIRGPFPIMSTPFHEDGSFDWETLARFGKFTADCGLPGVIWGQSEDAADLSTLAEKEQAYETLATALEGRKTTLCCGCNGTTDEMAAQAEAVERVAKRHPKTNVAIISRPPNDGHTQDDLRKYFHRLGEIAHRPVIIQTVNSWNATHHISDPKKKIPSPSIPLLVELAKWKHDVFGYIKEETDGLAASERMMLEVAEKPAIHTVFSAAGGWGWLYQSRRFGSEGLITERCAYADLLVYIWERLENGDDGTLDAAYAHLLLMLNLKNVIPGNQLRGYHLYVLQKRGVFKNLVSRTHPSKDDKSGKPWQLHVQKLSNQQKDEIDATFASLRPYLRLP